MKRQVTIFIGAILLFIATVNTSFGDEPPKGFQAVFNGRDLSGWQGSPKYWKVEDGCLTGVADGTLKYNRFIIWRGGKLKNFELRAKVKVSPKGNSGIQYRGTYRPDLGEWVVTGYQCDVVPRRADYDGMLYEERGRRILAHTGEKVIIDVKGQPWVVGKFPVKKFKPDEWHDYRVLARGNHHQHWIDGHPTVDVIDLDEKGRKLEGVLAVQVHVGPPMKIQYKDFLVKHLPDDLPIISANEAKIPATARKVVPQGKDRPKKKSQVKNSNSIALQARFRKQDATKKDIVSHRTLSWDPKKTAIIICDMWDDHYCRCAARRVAEMAPRMNEVITNARKQGVLIIHCPSGCMNVYKDTPQRELALQAPPVKTLVPLKRWCYLDSKTEAPLPIDDSMPCEDENPRERKRFYTRQIKTLKIAPSDAVTDSAEAYYLMRQKGITNAIIMGVHTNMCVLGRPFGIRQLKYQGMNVVLMRDMTDSMYNPKQRPFVSHVRGTELVVEHIERHWCPTVVSTAFTGKSAFRFEHD